MAKQAAAIQKKPGVFDRIRGFFDDIWLELKKVTWPSKEDIKSSTSVVVLLLALLAAITGIIDIVFQFLMVLFFKLS